MRIRAIKFVIPALAVAIATPLLGIPQKFSWFEQPADLSIQELLELSFKLDLGFPIPADSFSNSFIQTAVDEDPQKTLVMVNVLWSAIDVSQTHLRTLMNTAGDGYLRAFQQLAINPMIKKRLDLKDPSENIIVLHLNQDAMNDPETANLIGVSFKGITYFEQNEMMQVLERRLKE